MVVACPIICMGEPLAVVKVSSSPGSVIAVLMCQALACTPVNESMTLLLQNPQVLQGIFLCILLPLGKSLLLILCSGPLFILPSLVPLGGLN